MTESDRFDLFLCKAVSSPNSHPPYRYYLLNNDLLVIQENNVSKFSNESLIELPKITVKEKKDFLLRFAQEQNKAAKDYILELLKTFDDTSEFDISNDLKKIDWGVGFDFFIESGRFLLGRAEELYSIYGLNESMRILNR